MNIGVDATVWMNQRGYGRHARLLFLSLMGMDNENHYTFVIDSPDIPSDIPDSGQVIQVKAQMPTVMAASSDSRRSLGDMWRMSRALSNPEFDVLVFPTVYSYVPVFSRARKILFIHDIIPEKFPEYTLPSPTARYYWQFKSYLGRLQSNVIITVSDYSKKLIIQHYKVNSKKVYVVGLAPDPIFRFIENPILTPTLSALGIDRNSHIIVYVGGFGPHKNVSMLVDVLTRLMRLPDYSDLKCVLVGEYRKEVFYSTAGEIQTRIEEHGLSGRIQFTGYLPDDELVLLLNLSTVLVLPSMMEGFGLPAVEAAACGCPVIATNASPLPSILGRGGLYFDPTKPEELEERLIQVLSASDLRHTMKEAGQKAIQALSWEKSAEQMKAIIDQVGHGNKTA